MLWIIWGGGHENGITVRACGRIQQSSRANGTCTKSADDISELLRAWSGGDQLALDELTPIVYAELRRLAHRYARERPEHDLQTSALVR
ncbi:MAG: hypothetical protein Udaeo2_28400 [Candidatus Udaeobacter sp.]|nr:MAG: hypothetical protein Udaeo2_28400 [Candidatus Udaeobacter sp.]